MSRQELPEWPTKSAKPTGYLRQSQSSERSWACEFGGDIQAAKRTIFDLDFVGGSIFQNSFACF